MVFDETGKVLDAEDDFMNDEESVKDEAPGAQSSASSSQSKNHSTVEGQAESLLRTASDLVSRYQRLEPEDKVQINAIGGVIADKCGGGNVVKTGVVLSGLSLLGFGCKHMIDKYSITKRK